MKEKIKELKKTSKGRAIWRLIKWGVFFLILFLFLIISAIIGSSLPKRDLTPKPPIHDVGPSQMEEEVLTKDILKRKLEELKTGSYTYEYGISIGSERVVFNGNKNDNVKMGYKENKDGILKYYIDEMGIYRETLTEKVLIDNLYEGVNYNYLDFDYLFQMVENLEYVLNKNHNCQYPLYEMQDGVNKYSFHFGNSVSFKNNYINEISITALNEEYNYLLSFNDFRRKA